MENVVGQDVVLESKARGSEEEIKEKKVEIRGRRKTRKMYKIYSVSLYTLKYLCRKCVLS
jgi:hypothetical protein